MKPWAWFAIGGIWLLAIIVPLAAPLPWGVAGFGVSVSTSKWVNPNVALGIAGLMVNVVFWGWTIPIAIGFVRLVKERRGKQ